MDEKTKKEIKKFLEKIERIDGCAPSVGYATELAQQAKKLLKIIK
ncbi:hypothetical protein EZS27_003908 [termite gut metagenome]|uniref:Uncharacterized protein n=1 Tax=termite gut metagenome TaxID=433724 RepID=A0A5J4SU28_9ZZZZ